MNHSDDPELSQLIQRQATRYVAPPPLRAALLAQLAPPPPAGRWRAWLRAAWPKTPWLPTSAAFASGILVSLVAATLYTGGVVDTALDQEVLGGHLRSLQGSHLADVASTEQHTVKPWFTGKLDYSPPVQDFATEGFPLVGGRLDYLNQRAVAALVYKHQLHTINLFVWPTKPGALQAPQAQARQGFNLVHWSDGSMQYWAVSDLGPTELQKFAQLWQAPRPG